MTDRPSSNDSAEPSSSAATLLEAHDEQESINVRLSLLVKKKLKALIIDNSDDIDMSFDAISN